MKLEKSAVVIWIMDNWIGNPNNLVHLSIICSCFPPPARLACSIQHITLLSLGLPCSSGCLVHHVAKLCYWLSTLLLHSWDLLIAASVTLVYFFWLLFLTFCTDLFVEPSLTSQHHPFLPSVLQTSQWNPVDCWPEVIGSLLLFMGCLENAAPLPKLFVSFLSPLILELVLSECLRVIEGLSPKKCGSIIIPFTLIEKSK